MKKWTYLLSLIFVCCFMGCNDDTVVEKYTYYVNEPVFMDATEFRNSVKVTEVPQKIDNRGKICFYNGYLYISESAKGIHIIDNRNSSNPVKIGFIELMGNGDLTVKNDKLYADSFIDLVWFDISNPAKPIPAGRLEGVFPDGLPPIDEMYWSYSSNFYYKDARNTDKIVVDWIVEEKKGEYTYSKKDRLFNKDWDYSVMSDASPGGMSAGIVGSMSRFGLYDDYLYAIIEGGLSIFNISGEEPVVAIDRQYLDRSIETIFPYKNCLFMGSPNGLYIYSVTNPLAPEYESYVSHVYGCDPVVVENDIAYVTVHAGNICGQNNNQLIVLDVRDVKKPYQIVAYNMTRPKGLGIDNKTLFICDEGLKIFDAENPQTIMANMLLYDKGMEGFDVIPYNNVLMMIAEDGLYQYDYSNLDNIQRLSKLSF